MDKTPHQIVFTDWMNESFILVKFNDGRTVMYTANVLYATIPSAHEVSDAELEGRLPVHRIA